MQKLEYKIEIAATPEKVWNTMLGRDTYPKWTNVSWPGSQYEGKWEAGEEVKFIGPEGGGTLAFIKKADRFHTMEAEHVGVIGADGTIDRDSEPIQGWLGTKENYYLSPKGNGTELRVEIVTGPDWVAMFEEGWPGALKELKKLTEGK